MKRPFRKIRHRVTSLRPSTRRKATAIARLVELFDAEWYLERYPDVVAEGMDPIRHFRDHGFKEGRQPNRFIDPDWYARVYKDLGSKSALMHYAQIGSLERRDPGPEFSISGYLTAYPDVASDGVDPLLHFIRHGRVEGRRTFRPMPVGYRAAAQTFEEFVDRFSINSPSANFNLHVADETLLRINETMLRRGTRVQG